MFVFSFLLFFKIFLKEYALKPLQEYSVTSGGGYTRESLRVRPMNRTSFCPNPKTSAKVWMLTWLWLGESRRGRRGCMTTHLALPQHSMHIHTAVLPQPCKVKCRLRHKWTLSSFVICNESSHLRALLVPWSRGSMRKWASKMLLPGVEHWAVHLTLCASVSSSIKWEQ